MSTKHTRVKLIFRTQVSSSLSHLAVAHRVKPIKSTAIPISLSYYILSLDGVHISHTMTFYISVWMDYKCLTEKLGAKHQRPSLATAKFVNGIV